MLEKPDLADDLLCAHLRTIFGLEVRQVTFLPLGADGNTAVYRATTGDRAYFVKLRRERFREVSVTLPYFLHESGLEAIIPPLPALHGANWTRLGPYFVICYPFVAGESAFNSRLTEGQCRQFGRALRALHSAVPPPSLLEQLPRETFVSRWPEVLSSFLNGSREVHRWDAAAADLLALLDERRGQLKALLDRSNELAARLAAAVPPFVICHSDIHGGNLLLTSADGCFIVDWDDPILAPKERDLMFIGGSVGSTWRRRADQEQFYGAYGDEALDLRALAYYRHVRIIEDIALYSQDLLATAAGGADRAQALANVQSNFAPGGTIEMATGAYAAWQRGGTGEENVQR